MGLQSGWQTGQGLWGACATKCVGVHAHACIHVETRGSHWVSLPSSAFPEAGTEPGTHLFGYSSQSEDSGVPFLCLPTVRLWVGDHTYVPSIYVDAGNLNSGLYACLTSALPVEPPSWSQELSG